MVILTKKGGFDKTTLETGDYTLGYDKIELLFNLGPYPSGGHCLLVRVDGKLDVNSNDLMHDLDGYEASTALGGFTA